MPYEEPPGEAPSVDEILQRGRELIEQSKQLVADIERRVAEPRPDEQG